MHKFVSSCSIEADEREGALVLAVTVKFSADVIGFSSFGDSNDRMEFIEQLAIHLKEGSYEESSDALNKLLLEMVNLTASRQLILNNEEGIDTNFN